MKGEIVEGKQSYKKKEKKFPLYVRKTSIPQGLHIAVTTNYYSIWSKSGIHLAGYTPSIPLRNPSYSFLSCIILLVQYPNYYFFFNTNHSCTKSFHLFHSRPTKLLPIYPFTNSIIPHSFNHTTLIHPLCHPTQQSYPLSCIQHSYICP